MKQPVVVIPDRYPSIEAKCSGKRRFVSYLTLTSAQEGCAILLFV